MAVETVFSHWRQKPDGTIESKIDWIRDFQSAGYFVLLIFVGLTNLALSRLRVQARVLEGGHAVPPDRLEKRFGNTQRAIAEAAPIADATVFVDNSLDAAQAFTLCRVQTGSVAIYDMRDQAAPMPPAIFEWLERVAPR